MKPTVSNALFMLSLEVVESAKDDLAEGIAKGVECKNFDLLLKAFNRYQEDERDGVDYIFDTHSTEDAICALQCGVTLSQLAALNPTRFFMYGVNHQTPRPFATHLVMHILSASANVFLPIALYNVGKGIKEYDAVYQEYVAPATYEAD